MKLVFVYAADGDLLSSLRDYVHKLVSPKTYPCTLCALTYGPLGPRPAWTVFLESLPMESKFLHRDELRGPWQLPVVLLQRDDATYAELVAAKEIDACPSLEALCAIVREAVQRVHH